MTEPVGRRRFLMSVPALLLAPRAFAQYASGRLRITSFNHVSLNVADLKRSTEFYQGLFGMPIQSRQGATSVQLRIGAGPQFLNLSGAGAKPGIDHMCVGIESFDVTRVLKVLAEHGVAKSDERGAMKVQVQVLWLAEIEIWLEAQYVPDGMMCGLLAVPLTAKLKLVAVKLQTPAGGAELKYGSGHG